MRTRSRRLSTLATVAIVAAAISACGGDDDGEETRATPQPAEPEQPLSAEQERGRQLFVGTCGSCHTLESAGTQGAIGPDLDELGPDRQRVLAAIEEGPGAMPSGLLSGQEAEDVASFVSSNSG